MKMERRKGEMVSIDRDAPVSPAVAMIAIVREYNHEVYNSNDQNHMIAVRSAIHFAIRHLMRFNQDDFKKHGLMGYEYADASEKNSFYELACKAKNASAYLSIEHAIGRKPFLIGGKRVYPGLRFTWQEKRVRCTSINDGAGYLTAVQASSDGLLIKRPLRFRILRSEIRQASLLD